MRLLYDRGYRPITVAQLVDRDSRDVAPGMSPVVFTFDDATPEQFSYVEHDGRLEIDSNSVVGISLAFNAAHPDWKLRCATTVWHGQLSHFSDAAVQEQIARGLIAIDSAVPGYKVRTLALPQGLWPKNRELAWRGAWTSPRTGQAVSYDYGTVLEVTGGPVPGPLDSSFDGRRLKRFIVFEGRLRELLDRLDSTSTRFMVP